MPSRTICVFTFTAAVLVGALASSRGIAAVIAPEAGDAGPAPVPRANAARPEVHWFSRPRASGSTVLYVSNYDAGTVDVFAGGQPPMTAQIVHLGAPTGLAVDARGNLYVAEMAHHDVLEFPHNLSAVIGNFALGGSSGNGNALPLGVAVTPDGNKLYVADAEREGAVEVFAPPRRTAVQVLRDPSLAGGAVYPAIDTAGNVYVTYRTVPAAAETFALGIFSPGGAFQTAKLPGNPIDVVPDGSGNLLVDDFSGTRVSSLWTYTSDAKMYPTEFGLPFGSEAFARGVGTTAIFVAAIGYSVVEVPYPAGSPNTPFADGDRHYGIAVYPPAALGAPWTARTTAITEYSTPTTTAYPYGITSGPNGTIWFTEPGDNKIGRITASGSMKEYPIPTPTSFPKGIAAGPDGAVWFTEYLGNKIGRITPAGRISEYRVPTKDGGPFGITAGPDGNLWFTEISRGKVGRITTAGRVSEYPTGSEICNPGDITAGPDGALWMIVSSNGYSNCERVGRITTDGTYSSSPALVSSASYSLGITAGPDATLWFTVPWTYNGPGGTICRITTDGALAEYPLATYTYPEGIAWGHDGALWFTDPENGNIGRITTAGSVTTYPIPTYNATPFSITTGADGALWFTENSGNKIGRILL